MVCFRTIMQYFIMEMYNQSSLQQVAPQNPSQNVICPESTGKSSEGSYERVRQPVLVFLTWVILQLAVSIFNYINIFLLMPEGTVIVVSIMSFLIVGGIVYSCYLAPWREVICLYFVLDNLLFSSAITILGFIGQTMLYYSGNGFQIMGMALTALFFLCTSGHFRVMMRYSLWHKWQVVVIKLSLLASGLLYFYLGVRFMLYAFSYTFYMYPAFDDIMTNLLMLYVFGAVAFYQEMFSKLGDFDGTVEFHYRYTLKTEEEKQADEGKKTQPNQEEFNEEEMERLIYAYLKQKENKRMDQQSFVQVQQLPDGKGFTTQTHLFSPRRPAIVS